MVEGGEGESRSMSTSLDMLGVGEWDAEEGDAYTGKMLGGGREACLGSGCRADVRRVPDT